MFQQDSSESRIISRKPDNRIYIFILAVCLLSSLSTSTIANGYDTSHFYDSDVTDARKVELNNQVKNSPIQPANTHPRLYGTNEAWYASIEHYEALDPDCTWLGENGQGTIKNVKDDWDQFTLGGQKCGNGNQALPNSIEEHKTANAYLTGSIERWNRDAALRIVHLIRRMNYCHEIAGNCQYTQEEIDRLSSAFLTYEFDRLSNAPRNSAGYIAAWHKGYQGKFFDLGAYPAFKLWTLILDTFWDSNLLSEAQRQYIFDELEAEIDSYIEIYHLPKGASGTLGRWAIHNGNNWTPILNAAATFWAITFWHEEGYQEKAREVMDIVLESSWLHRDSILADGAYEEGPGYLSVSLNGSLEINRLLLASFGQPNHAMKWGLMGEKTPTWMLENIASDGRFIDFGDAWARTGYSDMHLMDLLYWEETVGLASHGTVTADACLLEDYFATSYYSHVFYDPWGAPEHYARDFYHLTSQCQRNGALAKTLTYPDYQLGTLRTYLLGATNTAQDVTDSRIRNRIADQTFLAGNAVDNSLSHRELDFGGVIWSAYGNRLLSDWGYGELSKGYEFYKTVGSTGHYIASNYDTLSFSLKQINGSVDVSRFYINLKLKGVSKRLTLSDYITDLDSNWTNILIPLADFGLNEADWIGAGNGLEYVSFTTNGFVRNGEFGIDEIKILDASGNDAIVWYGDSHSESLHAPTYGTTPQLSNPNALYISGIETEGGANGTASWVTFYASGTYSKADIYYSEHPDDFYVKNYMDYLPIGANTLVVPKAQDATSTAPQRTNKSQLKGHAGELHELDVNGKAALHFNGSRVYGRDLNEGHLDYFHRYLIPLSDGNKVIVDSFKTKAGNEDKIQEFWYSYKNNDATCAKKAQDVMQSIDANGALLLTSRCNTLQANEDVESYGRITAASLESGAFVLGAPQFMENDQFFNRFIEDNGLYMINRLSHKEQRRLARYVPDNEVSEDVRVFLLQASTSDIHANATVEKVACGSDVCFNVNVVGGDSLQLVLQKTEGQYVLAGTDLTLPPVDGDVDPIPTNPNSVLLKPVSFTASHPDRVSEPEKLFDEQTDSTEKPIHGESLPEFRHSRPRVNLSASSTILPLKQAVATDSPYGRAIYVDESGAPLSATFTVELASVASLTEILYYDISSTYRQGQLIIEVSTDGNTWTQVYDGMTGEYRKWVAISLDNHPANHLGSVDAKYIRFEFPEENSAKGITEVMLYGEVKTVGQEMRVDPNKP
ncbi:discoidin domain-containing protein [Marinomonas agarivorans]|nr:discoidin domain-containing protein [Marinomonas agarivorans]